MENAVSVKRDRGYYASHFTASELRRMLREAEDRSRGARIRSSGDQCGTHAQGMGRAINEDRHERRSPSLSAL
jgi:hypothetical protein